VEDIVAGQYPGAGRLAQRLRALVMETLPEVEERAYPVWKGIGYVHPEAGYVCGVFFFPDHVALGFERGVLLADPEGLLRTGRTSGKKVRYLEVRTMKDIRVRALRRLLKDAVSLRTRRGRSRE
jgi:hypothetical protein